MEKGIVMSNQEMQDIIRWQETGVWENPLTPKRSKPKREPERSRRMKQQIYSEILADRRKEVRA